MRALLFLICICIVTSCTSQYEVEDKLYDCSKKTLQSIDLNSDQVIIDFENYLIKNKFLKNTSPDGYLQLIDSLTKPNRFHITIPEELETSLFASFSFPKIINNCFENVIDSTEIKKSRIFEVQNEMEKVFQKMTKTGDLNPEKIKKDLLQIFRRNDFQHPIYKLLFYNLLTMYISI